MGMMQDARTGLVESEPLTEELLAEWERRIAVTQESLEALFVAIDINLDGKQKTTHVLQSCSCTVIA